MYTDNRLGLGPWTTAPQQLPDLVTTAPAPTPIPWTLLLWVGVLAFVLIGSARGRR